MLSQSRNMKEMREKNRIEQRHRKQMLREFPGGPVVRTSHSHCQWPRFHPSLVRELKSYNLSSTAKKTKQMLRGYIETKMSVGTLNINT